MLFLLARYRIRLNWIVAASLLAACNVVHASQEAGPVAAPVGSVAGDVGVVDVAGLGEAFDAFYRFNPELQFERERLSQSGFNLEAARGEWFPVVELSSSVGHKDVKTTASDSYRYDETALVVRQNLFRGFGTQSRWRSSNVKFERDSVSFARKQNDLLLAVLESYSEVLRTRANYDAVRSTQVQMSEWLETIRTRSLAGSAASVEVERVRSRLLSVETELTVQQRQRDSAENAFFALTGALVSESARFPVPAHRLFPDFDRFLDLDAVLSMAEESHPLVIEASLLRQVRKHEVREARSTMLPSVDLVYRVADSSNTNGNLDNPLADQTDQSVVLQLNWTLFNGNSTRNQVSAASAAERGSEYAIRDVVVRSRARAQDSFISFVNAQEGYRAAQESVSVARKVSESYRSLVAMGRRTLVEVANVYEEEMRAVLDYNNQRHALFISSYRLPHSTGFLTRDVLDGVFRP